MSAEVHQPPLNQSYNQQEQTPATPNDKQMEKPGKMIEHNQNGTHNLTPMADASLSPPPIPHISANVTSLSTILERQSLNTYKQLKEFIITLQSNSQTDNVKKMNFLDLLVHIRENFVRIYVLCKWARNSKSIEKLIDLFVWLREQNQLITNALASVGTVKQSLVSAKLPNPDLSTAMEVLIKGGPQLPTYNYLPQKPLNPELILKTLRYLNVELATRMALQEQLPELLYNYKIQDGRVIFRVPNAFEFSISIADDSPDAKFFLVDFKLGFQSKDNELVPSVTSLPRQTFHNLEKISNMELRNGLTGLFKLLQNYSITCKLYLLHRQLIQLRMGLWKGHLTHSYNADKCVVVITYWLKRKSEKSTIEIGKFRNNELGFRWIKEGMLHEVHDLELMNPETGVINIENLVRNIIKKHIEISITDIQSSINAKVENVEKMLTIYNNSQLVLNVSHSKTVIYSIDALSGDGYFQNPTPLMSVMSKHINMDPRLTSLKLLSLRLEIQLNELSSMLSATGWINVEVIKLSANEMVKLNINYEHLKQRNLANQLLALKFYRRKEWPSGWLLTVAVSGYSSNIEWWCSRIKSATGQWSISWADPILLDCKESQYDYASLLSLVKTTTSKLLSNLIITELENLGCKLKIADKNNPGVKSFMAANFGLNLDDQEKKEDNSLIVLDNKSLFDIPNCRESLVMSITIESNQLDISIFGKLQNELKLSDISFTYDKNNSIQLNPMTSIFEVNSKINLAEKLKFNSGLGTALSTFSITSGSSEVSILGDSLLVLNKLSSLLSLLQLISNDQSLKVLDISLTEMSFQYGSTKDESIKLIILSENQDSVSIELPEGNPHRYCSKYLNNIVSNDFARIKNLVVYLKLSLPLFKAYDSLISENNAIMQKFIEANALPNLDIGNLKLSPSNGFELNLYDFEMLKISYYRAIDKKIEKKLRYEKYRVNLTVQMRHKTPALSLKKSLFVVQLDTSISDLSSDENVKMFNEKVVKAVGKYFTGEKQITLKSPGESTLVYLRNSVVCDYKCVEEVIGFLHGVMKNVVLDEKL